MLEDLTQQTALQQIMLLSVTHQADGDDVLPGAAHQRQLADRVGVQLHNESKA